MCHPISICLTHTYPCIEVLLQSIKRKYLIEPVFVCDLDNFRFNKIIMESAKKRKYNEDYIKYGFTFILKEGQELPQCVVCCKVLSEGSMKPSFLKRHLSGYHPDLATKDIDFFRAQRVRSKANPSRSWRAIQSTDSGGRSCIVHGGFAHRSGEETAYNCRELYTPLLQGHRPLRFGR